MQKSIWPPLITLCGSMSPRIFHYLSNGNNNIDFLWSLRFSYALLYMKWIPKMICLEAPPFFLPPAGPSLGPYGSCCIKETCLSLDPVDWFQGGHLAQVKPTRHPPVFCTPTRISMVHLPPTAEILGCKMQKELGVLFLFLRERNGTGL